MEELTNEQKDEIQLCANDFNHFVKNWVKIVHPKKGLIPLGMYSYQERLIKAYETHRFNILTKFRQGGFSTITAIWGLWNCMFKTGQHIMWVSPGDSEAILTNNMVRSIIKNLPEWMQPKISKNNNHLISFSTESNFYFGGAATGRGRALSLLSLLILDEAAFIKQMDKYWKAMYPTISCGGNVIVISTPNGLANWFEETYHNACDKKNAFNVFESDYQEHPDYNNPTWVAEMKKNLGEEGWHQEVLQSFIAFT